MPYPRASVIIVTWNGRDHLACCLPSLAAQTFREFEVIVVDNGSSDGTAELIRTSYPWVRLKELPHNTGFATGNNRGLGLAGGNYIITLNNDTVADPQWLQTLIRVADSRPEVGMVASRICSFDDADVIDSVGVGICRDGMSRGRFRRRTWSSLGMAEVEEILFPSACAALYRRSMLDKTGFFDDDFFAYAEDTDLGLRGRLAGWGAVAATGAVVRHRYSRTGGTFSALKVYLVERNHYWAAFKCFPRHLLPLIPLFTLARVAWQIRAVLRREGSGGEFLAGSSQREVVRAIVRGNADAAAGLPLMLRKRRRIKQSARISPGAMSKLLSTYRLSFKELLDC